MPSQLGKCPCCTCKDCKCISITEKGIKGIGGWKPPPKIICKKNDLYGKFIFEDSCDCGGMNCCRQRGCTNSIICLDKKTVFRFRITGCLETTRDGKHIGTISYRKIGCKKTEDFSEILRVESKKTSSRRCCRAGNGKTCEIILNKGKYEFKFTADSVDEIDHCENVLRYYGRWCYWQKDKKVCPKLPVPVICDELCCSVAPLDCDVCMPDYLTFCEQYTIIDCESVNVV